MLRCSPDLSYRLASFMSAAATPAPYPIPLEHWISTGVEPRASRMSMCSRRLGPSAGHVGVEDGYLRVNIAQGRWRNLGLQCRRCGEISTLIASASGGAPRLLIRRAYARAVYTAACLFQPIRRPTSAFSAARGGSLRLRPAREDGDRAPAAGQQNADAAHG